MFIRNSLGLELDDGTMCLCVSKNSILPITKTYTFRNKQTNIEIKLFEGQRFYAKDNVLKSCFSLLLPINSQIKLNITIDENGKCKIMYDNKLCAECIVNISKTSIKDCEDLNTILYDSELFEKDILINEVIHMYKTFNKPYNLVSLKASSISDLRCLLDKFR